MGPLNPLKVEDIPEDQILFYDIETDSQFAPYCRLKMIGAKIGIEGEPFLVDDFKTRKRFKEMLASDDVIKVAFNNINFDDLVLWRHGFAVNECNRHDVFLMAKTVAPGLPAYSLKFLNWYFFGDFHRPEIELNLWCKANGKEMWDAPNEVLAKYCLYDVSPQTVNLFCMFWEVVQRELHWAAYTEVELSAGLPMEEIMLRGGEFIDIKKIPQQIAMLQKEKMSWEHWAHELTAGQVTNPNSVKQVGAFLQDETQIAVSLSDKGNFSIPKSVLLEFVDPENQENDASELLRCTYEVRNINNQLNYLRNYETACGHDLQSMQTGWIPKQYSLSGAATRRILSNSQYKLNFQNSNDAAKAFLVVPEGWIGFWIDATQIENIVHIYESKDHARRTSYENDPDWNEYVWLCQAALRLSPNVKKKELDDKTKYRSPVNPSWSLYKQFKTVKLGANFGMGVDKFCKTTNLSKSAGKKAYDELHRACPAIRALQDRVRQDLTKYGYVQDSFGHIYKGDPKKAYKVVAYLIQGCGTGTLPKVQIRANYDTLHKFDEPFNRPAKYDGASVVDIPRGVRSYGIMCGTTHDENSGRISLGLGVDNILLLLDELMYNMTEKFSPYFNDIPLRAKLSVSRTTEREKVGLDLAKTEDREKLIAMLQKP